MSLSSAIKAAEREYRRELRDAKARYREFERDIKERAKASVRQEAELEVQAFDAQIQSLLSVHKECGPTWNWSDVAAQLGTASTDTLQSYEMREQRNLRYEKSSDSIFGAPEQARLATARARDTDVRTQAEAMTEKLRDEAKELRVLARRILSGDTAAYSEAVTELNPFAELSAFGSVLHFTFHNRNTVEGRILVKGREVIPTEQKSLTSTGKLSSKAMPKARFQELYPDYVCGCVLRIGRELFALLPLDFVFLTASVDDAGESKPVVSVILDRSGVEQLQFEHLDASDTVETFRIRSSLKKSRST